MMGKRVLLILLPVAIAVGVFWGIYSALKPKLQLWILAQVNRLSEEKLPMQVNIQEVDWSLLFPEIELSGIEIKPKNFDFPPVHVQKVSASLDLLALISGRLAISSLLLEEPKIEVDLDPLLKKSSSEKKQEPLPLGDFFQFLRKVPVSRVGLHQAQLLLQSEKLKTGLLLGSTDLLVVKGKDRLILQWDFNDAVVDQESTGEVPFRLQGEATMNSSSLDISNLKLGVLGSLLTAKGSLTNLPEILLHPQGSVDVEILSDLDRVSSVGKNLMKLPDLQGKVSASGRLNWNGSRSMESGFKFSGQRLRISHYEIGDIQFLGRLLNDTLTIPHISLTNEAGLLDIHDFEMVLAEKDNPSRVSAKAHLSSEQVDLNELLQRLGIGDLPLELLIGTDLKCSGPLYPELDFRCSGEAKGDQLEVRTGDKYQDTLVLVDSFAAKGDFAVTSKDVRYRAQLQVGEDDGSSDGVIGFKEGFKINYASPLFHFKNLRRLAGLKMEGATEVQGSTQGDSHAATFDMKLNTKDFVFENFALGSPSGSLSYESGLLKFDKVEATFTTTHYLADLKVDVNNKRLVADGAISRFDMLELLAVFERIFQLPVDFTGFGNASFHVEGPFSLGKLSYNLQTNVQQGSLAGENFDSLSLQMTADAGEMKIQNARLKKGRSEITATGLSHPNGHVDIKIQGQGLPLEESENISKLGSQISGLMNIQTNLKGYILEPDVKIVGQINQLSVEEQDFAPSTFEMEFFKQMMLGKTNLFGGQLQSQFKIPFRDSAPFQIDLKAQDWNYTTLLALVGGGSLLSEYKASLTGDLQLASEGGGLWAASGHGRINNFLLQRGGLILRNTLPMEMTMTNGSANLTNFRVEGDQTYFDLRGKNISKEDLNIRLDGQANLRLFQIFVPFLEELNGTAQIGADFSGPLLKPEVLGSANVRNGFIKLKGFPHAFEKTQGDVQFSQSKILINGFSGSLAGGSFEGDGSVLIAGPQNLPTHIKAHLANVSLNVPDRVRTSGDADVTFSGNWFPFTLAGTYHVQGGFMDKEFAEESGANNLKQSSYLPKMILQSAFEPVLLDLNIILEKPLTMKNSMVDGSVSGNIQVKGAPAHPALGGQVIAEKGTKAIIRDKVFDVQTANVRFNNDTDINPALYVNARSRIDEYDITVLIQGTAKNQDLKFSSVPPLSDQDIISLIALGVKTESLEKQVQAGNKAKEETLKGAALGVFSQKGIFKKLQDTAGVQLQFSTSYDDTRNVSVQRVTLSKKLSDRVRASATQTSASSSSSNEYSLQYNFTDSLSAIGRYEDRRYNENATNIDTNRESQSILGLDLEFKKEFK